MRVLALDGALARCSALIREDGRVLARRVQDGPRGHASLLPALAREVLAEAGGGACDAVAVTVGPGGFTGLRAAIALARGFALGWGVPCLGVTLGEAFAASLPESERDGQALWVAVDTKRGRIALERPDAVPAVFAAADLPRPMGPVLLAGDAAEAAAEALRAMGADVRLTALRLPEPEGVAAVAAQRLRGELPPREAEPLYLEPPAVRG